MPTATKKAAAPRKSATKAAPIEKETTVSETPEATETAMQKARSSALSRIRDAHREEYNTFLVEEAAKLGVEWTPRPTAKERAAAKMRALVAEYPELKDELTS